MTSCAESEIIAVQAIARPRCSRKVDRSGDAAHARRDNRQPGGQRLKEDIRQSFVAAGKAKNVQRGQEWLGGEITKHQNTAGDALTLDSPADRCFERTTADDDEPRAGML